VPVVASAERAWIEPTAIVVAVAEIIVVVPAGRLPSEHTTRCSPFPRLGLIHENLAAIERGRVGQRGGADEPRVAFAFAGIRVCGIHAGGVGFTVAAVCGIRVYRMHCQLAGIQVLASVLRSNALRACIGASCFPACAWVTGNPRRTIRVRAHRVLACVRLRGACVARGGAHCCPANAWETGGDRRTICHAAFHLCPGEFDQLRAWVVTPP